MSPPIAALFRVGKFDFVSQRLLEQREVELQHLRLPRHFESEQIMFANYQ